jgi:hypothetical protein
MDAQPGKLLQLIPRTSVFTELWVIPELNATVVGQQAAAVAQMCLLASTICYLAHQQAATT